MTKKTPEKTIARAVQARLGDAFPYSTIRNRVLALLKPGADFNAIADQVVADLLKGQQPSKPSGVVEK